MTLTWQIKLTYLSWGELREQNKVVKLAMTILLLKTNVGQLFILGKGRLKRGRFYMVGFIIIDLYFQ
jgi:hypothetical protein